MGSWGSSGHCVETGLLGCTRGGERPAPGRGAQGAARGSAGLAAIHAPARQERPLPASRCRVCAPAGKGGAEPSLQERGSLAPRPPKGSPPEQGANRVLRVGEAIPGSLDCGRAREAASALLGRGHLCGPAAGWGGAAPLCGRAGLEPASLQRVGWERLRARTPSNARRLRTSRGVLSVLDGPAGKEGSRAADRSRAPLPSPLRLCQESEPEGSPAPPGRVGPGGVVQSKPLSPLFPSPHPAPGEGCFQPPPELQPLPACPRGPPRGPGGARPRGWGWGPWIRNLVCYLSLDTG